jgi:hypothetical protein
VFGVKNPSDSSVSTEVSLGSSTTPAFESSSNSVSLTAQAQHSSFSESQSNSQAGVASNYTLTGFVVPAGGIAAQTKLKLTFPSGTAMPTATSDYTLTDSTNSSSSGVYQVTPGSSGNTVYIEPTNALAAGDSISLAIDGVVNPSTYSNADQIEETGLTTGTVAVSSTVPTAATTYPNGALIKHGAQIDVVAGGYAFGIPTPTVFGEIRAMDRSSVVSGSYPTATTPAPGTLIHPVGAAGYWVVGANGDIYQFSSMTQFKQEGYVVSQVIPVPNTDGLTAGAGTPPTAATTMANGSLVEFGSTVYEYVGGVATKIQTSSQLASIQKMTGAVVVQGSGSTPTSATTSENGALVKPLGKAGVWVSSAGTLYQFMTASQFTTDGYSFQYVLPVATTGSYTLSSL